MSPNEIEAGEILWKYISELKTTEGTDKINFIARTSLDPQEIALLLPLADAVQNSQIVDASDYHIGKTEAQMALANLMQPPIAPISLTKAISLTEQSAEFSLSRIFMGVVVFILVGGMFTWLLVAGTNAMQVRKYSSMYKEKSKGHISPYGGGVAEDCKPK